MSTLRVHVCLLWRLPLANFGWRKVSVTHPCAFDCCFRMAKPGRTVMGVCYRWRRNPCLGCFLGVVLLGILYKLRRNCLWVAYFWKALELILCLKSWTKHNIILSAPLNISLRRLCPRPPNPNTLGKLKLSAFFMCY